MTEPEMSSTTVRHPQHRPARTHIRDWRFPALIGYGIILLSFVVVGSWAAYARIDDAIVAQGVVTVESNRETIQHLEGGIVREILVHEGQHVAKNQLLFRLADTQALANATALKNQLIAKLAQEARLVAERDGADHVSFPAELTNKADEPFVAQAISDERKEFAERRATLAGQISLLDGKIKSYRTEIQGLADELAASKVQLQLIEEELAGLRGLFDRGLVEKTRILALEREKSRLDAQIGRSKADSKKARTGIGETKLQIKELRKKFAEDVNSAIIDASQKIAELRDKARVYTAILKRIDIRAPRAGTVQSVRVATIGGVIRPGQPLLDLVPDNDALVINVHVSPTDIDAVHPDMKAEVRFSSFHSTILPIIMGRVISVSRDRLTDEQSKQPYFLARVGVDAESLPPEIRGRIMAGMSADVIVPTGERTVVSYFVHPLAGEIFKAFREQ